MAAPRSLLAVLAVAALAFGACGADGDQVVSAPDDEAPTGAGGNSDDDSGDPGGGGVPDGRDAALPEDACALVGDAAAITGLDLGEPVPGGDERRRVCAFSAPTPGGIGLTVGLEAGDRFDEKAETSAAAIGELEPVNGLGDRALFGYDDADIVEGVGGVLVGIGVITVDVSLQGADEATVRGAAITIAEAAVAAL